MRRAGEWAFQKLGCVMDTKTYIWEDWHVLDCYIPLVVYLFTSIFKIRENKCYDERCYDERDASDSSDISRFVEMKGF